MTKMLEKFKKVKLEEVERLKGMKKSDAFPKAFTGKRPGFTSGLKRTRPAIIAEIKKASPSRGELRAGGDAGELAGIYARSGAAAVSVLTEERYFRGNMQDLDRAASAKIPLLRKDFILDSLQVEHTACTPASAILFIVRFIDDASRLAGLIRLAGDLGLEAVVEVFNSEELKQARRAGAQIIQVNNRDLDTLQTDLENSRGLIGKKTDSETWISASGIIDPGQCIEMHALGFDACLVGTSIMLAADPGKKLKKLTGAGQCTPG